MFCEESILLNFTCTNITILIQMALLFYRKELKRFQDKLLQIDPNSIRSVSDNLVPNTVREQSAQNNRETVAQQVGKTLIFNK